MPKQESKHKKMSRRTPKSNFKDKEMSSLNENQCDKLTGSNDFNWYNLNKDLVAKAAKLPFGRPIGNSISQSVEQVHTGYDQTIFYNYTMPGIATFEMVPTIGCSLNGVQTIDVASKSIYSWVRHANSGHTNYDAPDLMIYLLAAANIYSAAGYLLKVYSCINTYNPENRYLPDSLLESIGINPSVITENIADFRYFCAQWYKKAQVLFTPKKFPMFEKAFWMFTQIYEEDKTGKSALYQYAPHGFYKFNPTKYTNGGCLEYMQLPAILTQTWSGLKNYFSSLLDAVIDDEDMGIMSGDIRKAFGEQVWTLGDFPFEATLKPVRDSFVLQQMHNTTPLNINVATMDIVQDLTSNSLLCFPEVELNAADATHGYLVYNYALGQVLIDIDSNVPSEEEVIEATQYTNFITFAAGISSARYTSYLSTTGYTVQGNSYILTNASDFACCNLAVYHIQPGVGLHKEDYRIGIWYEADDSSMTKSAYSERFARFRTMEWLPEIRTFTGVPFMSIHNYTLTTKDVIDNLHDCTWLSLLAIPASEHLK